VVEPTSTILDGANEVTHEAGTATGDLNVSGITTVDGTTTTDEAGNEKTFDVGTTEITEFGTDDGTFDH